MATILYPSGHQEERQPNNGHTFRLEELQAIVGGNIEIIPTKDGRIMVLNEEGKLLDLPRNEQATILANLATPADISRLRMALGDRLIYVGSDLEAEEADYIAGTVLVCADHEVE